MARRKKRRPWGSGSFFQRKSDQRWMGRVVVGKKPDGTPDKRQVSDKDKALAWKKFQALLDSLEDA